MFKNYEKPEKTINNIQKNVENVEKTFKINEKLSKMFQTGKRT